MFLINVNIIEGKGKIKIFVFFVIEVLCCWVFFLSLKCFVIFIGDRR